MWWFFLVDYCFSFLRGWLFCTTIAQVASSVRSFPCLSARSVSCDVRGTPLSCRTVLVEAALASDEDGNNGDEGDEGFEIGVEDKVELLDTVDFGDRESFSRSSRLRSISQFSNVLVVLRLSLVKLLLWTGDTFLELTDHCLQGAGFKSGATHFPGLRGPICSFTGSLQTLQQDLALLWADASGATVSLPSDNLQKKLSMVMWMWMWLWMWLWMWMWMWLWMWMWMWVWLYECECDYECERDYECELINANVTISMNVNVNVTMNVNVNVNVNVNFNVTMIVNVTMNVTTSMTMNWMWMWMWLGMWVGIFFLTKHSQTPASLFLAWRFDLHPEVFLKGYERRSKVRQLCTTSQLFWVCPRVGWRSKRQAKNKLAGVCECFVRVFSQRDAFQIFFFFFCQYIFYKDGQIANRS